MYPRVIFMFPFIGQTTPESLVNPQVSIVAVYPGVSSQSCTHLDKNAGQLTRETVNSALLLLAWRQNSGRGFCVVTQVLWHIKLFSRFALTCGYVSCTPPTSILLEPHVSEDCIENWRIGCVPSKGSKIHQNSVYIGYHLEMARPAFEKKQSNGTWYLEREMDRFSEVQKTGPASVASRFPFCHLSLILFHPVKSLLLHPLLGCWNMLKHGHFMSFPWSPVLWHMTCQVSTCCIDQSKGLSLQDLEAAVGGRYSLEV